MTFYFTGRDVINTTNSSIHYIINCA